MGEQQGCVHACQRATTMLKLSGVSLMLLFGVFAACILADGSEPASFENYRSECLRDPVCRRAYMTDPMLALEQRPSQRNKDWVASEPEFHSDGEDRKATTKRLQKHNKAEVYELESALYEQTLADGPNGGFAEARKQLQEAQAAFLSAKQAVKKAAQAHSKPTQKPVKVAK